MAQHQVLVKFLCQVIYVEAALIPGDGLFQFTSGLTVFGESADSAEELTVEPPEWSSFARPLDWSDSTQDKWTIIRDFETVRFTTAHATTEKTLGGLYGSLTSCQWIISHMVDDLKLIAGVS